MALRAVAFDLDGTLYAFHRLVHRAVVFGARNLRHSRAFWRVREEIRRVRPIQDFGQCQAELFAAAIGLDPEAARSWIESRIYGDWIRSFNGLRPHAHLLEALDVIEGRGLATAVLSDFPVTEKLGYLGLAGRFPVAMCSEESGYLKPNPEPFALLAGRLGVAPPDILYVGDSYVHDIEGAHRAGFMSAHLSRVWRRDDVADFRFSDYRRFPELIAGL